MLYSCMQIYFTQTFEKFLDKYFSNYFIDLLEFSEMLKKSFSDNLYLKRPVMKFKIKLNWVSYRVVWIIKWEIILPILIFHKKEKKFWENLIWNKELEILIDFYATKHQSDIENKKYKIY